MGLAHRGMVVAAAGKGSELRVRVATAETNSFPLGINFFHPSGLSVSVKETYRHQEGNFERASTLGVFENGHDDFWLLDAAINYRMPKRYGLITLGVTNLTNSHFQYFDPNINNASIQPERFFFGSDTGTSIKKARDA